MKTTVVIVARQGSSRLPGKALAQVKNNSIVGHMVNRIKECSFVSEVIIATTTQKEDDALEEFGRNAGVIVFRGHSEDVLDRIYNATVHLQTDLIVEIGGDCPFVGAKLLEKGIQHFVNAKADFVTNVLLPPYTSPDGYDFIGFTKEAISKVHLGAKLKSERYQPFQYIVRNKSDFKTHKFTLDGNYSHWRWTLDYREDLDFVRRIFDELYDTNPLFEFEEIKNLLEQKPSIVEINKMYHNPSVEFQAWSTGSYVSEVHDDIVSLLRLANEAEAEKDFAEALVLYRKIERFNAELIARAESKLREKSDIYA